MLKRKKAEVKETKEERKALSLAETKAKMKRVLGDMAEFADKSEAKKNELLVKAKKAKANNDTANFKLVCVGLAQTMALKNKVEKMMMTMDIVMTLKDVAEMTKGFVGGMEAMGNELADVTKGLKFAKAGKIFEGTMGKVSEMFEGLDAFIDDMSLGFDSMGLEPDPKLEKQISDMIEKEEISIDGSSDDFDKQFAERFKKLQPNKPAGNP